MKWCVLVLCAALLSGCAAQPVWETVQDTEMTAEPMYELVVELPEGAVETASRDGETLYEADGMEITTAVFLAQDEGAAVRALSGYEADRLTIMQTERDGLPEYRFAWVSETEEGGRLSQASLIMDGMQCYAVVCSAPEESSGFGDRCRQVFAGFRLSGSEPV